MVKAFILLVIIVSCGAEYGSRIEGGIWADYSDHPYAVSITAPRAMGRTHFATGTILNNRWILTAASHLQMYDEPRAFQVNTATQFYMSVMEKVVHPLFLYDPDSFDFDLCLLKIDNDIEFSENVQPIELFSEDSVAANLKGTLVGHVYSVGLKTVGTIDGARLHVSPIDDDICFTDVGGPFVVDNKVLGVTTLERIGCGLTDQYVTRFDANTINWINRVIA